MSALRSIARGFRAAGMSSLLLLVFVHCGGDDEQPPPPPPPPPSGNPTPPNFANATLEAYIKASNTKPGDIISTGTTIRIGLFGTGIAVDANTLVVGSPGERSCATGINGDQADSGCTGAGAVYVFTRSGNVWSQQAYLKPSNTRPFGSFGTAVAIEGNTLVVGAPGESSCATGIDGDQTNTGCGGAGSVSIFTGAGGAWVQQAYVKASNTEFQDGFGTSLSLDGDTLAVGAPLEKSCATGINGNQADNGCTDAGAVYVFVRTNGLWSQQAYLKASNTGPGDRFGSGVSVDADTLAVGAPFEGSCALGINGDQLNDACAGAGAGYLFTRSTDAWSQQAYLKASNTSSSSIPAIPGDGFGSALAFHGDSLAVGAPGEASCAMGIESDQTNRGCPRAGALYLFNRDGNVWSQEAYIKPSDTAAGDQFGSSVALNDDTLVVGAPFESSCATDVNGDQNQLGCFATGAVYVFNTRGEQTYVKPSYTRMPQPRFNPSDEFGFSVAINGGTLAVGAQKEASCATGVNGDAANSQCFGAGAAYVYVAP